MGGENSEIVDDTVDVVFESANFNGTSIRKTALALGMRTEASAKFEKGLDPMNTLPAVNRACELVELLGAGEVVDGVIDVLNYVPEPTVRCRWSRRRSTRLLGTDVSREEMVAYPAAGWTSPSRATRSPCPPGGPTCSCMADLAEEVARFYGYNNIPTTAHAGPDHPGRLYPGAEAGAAKLGAVCRAWATARSSPIPSSPPPAYDQIRLPEDDPRCATPCKILNPLGEDTSIMRTTTLPSMLEILTRNYNLPQQGRQAL